MPDIDKQVLDSILQPTERLLRLVSLAVPGDGALRTFIGVKPARDHGLVVVGRSPAAGSAPFTPAEAGTAEVRRRVVAELRRQDREPAAPGTPAGDVARAVALELGLPGADADDWAGRIGWTHLYRIGPVDGEPSPELRAAQQALAAQVFWREVLIWRPKRVLLLTGLDWAAPFLYANHTAELEPAAPGQLVEAAGALALQGAKVPAFVVTRPPEAGDADRAAEIVQAFASVGMGPAAEGKGLKGVTEITLG